VALLLARLLRFAPKAGMPSFAALPSAGKATLGIAGAIVLLFSVKTLARNPVWKNNLTLCASGIEDAPNSAYIHYLYANEMVKTAKTEAATDSLRNDSLYRAALGYYSHAIELDPGHAASYSELATTYRKLKQPQEALRNYALALRYDPKLTQAYNGMGVLYFEQKNYREALQQFSQAVRLNALDVTALRNLGSCYLLLKDGRNAADAFGRALRINPNDAVVLQYMGFAYEDMGNRAEANVYFEKARQAQTAGKAQ